MNKPTGTPDAPRAVDAGMEAAAKYFAGDDYDPTNRRDRIVVEMLASFAAEQTTALERENAALKAEREWVPVSERLPTTDGDYLVMLEYVGSDFRPVVDEFSTVRGRFTYHTRAVAWMPIPAFRAVAKGDDK
jgi:hypothetical protein